MSRPVVRSDVLRYLLGIPPVLYRIATSISSCAKKLVLSPNTVVSFPHANCNGTVVLVIVRVMWYLRLGVLCNLVMNPNSSVGKHHPNPFTAFREVDYASVVQMWRGEQAIWG
jgi:hypothetical protein